MTVQSILPTFAPATDGKKMSASKLAEDSLFAGLAALDGFKSAVDDANFDLLSAKAEWLVDLNATLTGTSLTAGKIAERGAASDQAYLIEVKNDSTVGNMSAVGKCLALPGDAATALQKSGITKPETVLANIVSAIGIRKVNARAGKAGTDCAEMIEWLVANAPKKAEADAQKLLKSALTLLEKANKRGASEFGPDALELLRKVETEVSRLRSLAEGK